MALPAELNAATTEIWGSKEPQDLAYKASPLLYFLLRDPDTKKFSQEKFDNSIMDPSNISHTGTELRYPLEVALPGGGAMNNATTVDHTQTQLYSYLSATMGTAYSEGVVNLTERTQNTGPAKIFDLAERKVKSARKKIQDVIATACLQFQNPDGGSVATNNGIFPGLPDCFNTAAGTSYLGISKTDSSIWAESVDANAYAMTFKQMQAIRRAAKVDDTGDGIPNIYFTSQTLKDAYEAGLETQQRFTDEAAVNAGWHNIKFGGVPIVVDRKLDSATNGIMSKIADADGTGFGPTSVIGLNLDYWKLQVHPEMNFQKTPWDFELNRPQILVMTIMTTLTLICTYRSANCWFYAVTAPARCREGG